MTQTQKIMMPEPVHRHHCRVLYGDTDAGGVVYYGNFMRYFEAGRTEYMRDLACTYREIEDLGLVLPVIECYARYKAPAIYDDLLLVETSLVQVKKISCRFNYRIFRENGPESRKLLVKGFTAHAVVDRSGRLARIPAGILEKLTALCQDIPPT